MRSRSVSVSHGILVAAAFGLVSSSGSASSASFTLSPAENPKACLGARQVKQGTRVGLAACHQRGWSERLTHDPSTGALAFADDPAYCLGNNGASLMVTQCSQPVSFGFRLPFDFEQGMLRVKPGPTTGNGVCIDRNGRLSSSCQAGSADKAWTRRPVPESSPTPDADTSKSPPRTVRIILAGNQRYCLGALSNGPLQPGTRTRLLPCDHPQARVDLLHDAASGHLTIDPSAKLCLGKRGGPTSLGALVTSVCGAPDTVAVDFKSDQVVLRGPRRLCADRTGAARDCQEGNPNMSWKVVDADVAPSPGAPKPAKKAPQRVRIASRRYQGHCLGLPPGPPLSAGRRLGLLPCSQPQARVDLEYDPESGQISFAADDGLCIAKGGSPTQPAPLVVLPCKDQRTVAAEFKDQTMKLRGQRPLCVSTQGAADPRCDGRNPYLQWELQAQAAANGATDDKPAKAEAKDEKGVQLTPELRPRDCLGTPAGASLVPGVPVRLEPCTTTRRHTRLLLDPQSHQLRFADAEALCVSKMGHPASPGSLRVEPCATTKTSLFKKEGSLVAYSGPRPMCIDVRGVVRPDCQQQNPQLRWKQ